MSELGENQISIEPAPVAPADYRLPEEVLKNLRGNLDAALKTYREQTIQNLKYEMNSLYSALTEYNNKAQRFFADLNNKQRAVDDLENKGSGGLVEMIERISQSTFWEFVDYDGTNVKLKTRERVMMREFNPSAGVNRLVDLGRFEIRLHPVNGEVRVFPCEDNVAGIWRSQGATCWHPFVSPSNNVCWGTGEDLSVRLRAEKKFDRLLEMLAGILTSQEPGANPYVQLTEFEEARKNPCIHCKHSKRLCRCPKCGCCSKKEPECDCRRCKNCSQRTRPDSRCLTCICTVCTVETGGTCGCCAICSKQGGNCDCRNCVYCAGRVKAGEACSICVCNACGEETRGSCNCCQVCQVRASDDHNCPPEAYTVNCLNCGLPWGNHNGPLCTRRPGRWTIPRAVDPSVPPVPSGLTMSPEDRARRMAPIVNVEMPVSVRIGGQEISGFRNPEVRMTRVTSDWVVHREAVSGIAFGSYAAARAVFDDPIRDPADPGPTARQRDLAMEAHQIHAPTEDAEEEAIEEEEETDDEGEEYQF